MFKTLVRKILPNPFDGLLISALKKKKKRFLLGWNRGLGDIPLGLFAIVHRIKWFIPDAKITFMIRPSLKEGFLLFPQVKTIIAPHWERGFFYSIKKTLKELNISEDQYDVIIEKPDPTYWMKHQIGRIRPYLSWNEKFDEYVEKFELSPQFNYMALQTHSDTDHSPWRDLPERKWGELFDLIDEKKGFFKVILFGIKKKNNFENKCIVDLRGKTTLLDVLSIIKNRCSYAILPDGGILSLFYYLSIDVPIKIISLWSDRQGILKQNVDSPNRLLKHCPIIREKEDFQNIDPHEILNEIK